MIKTFFSIMCTSFFLFVNAQNTLHYLEITSPAPPAYPYKNKPFDAQIRFQNLFFETLVDDNKQNNGYESRHINIESSELTSNWFSAEYIKGWQWNDGSGYVNISDIVYSIKEANKIGVFSPFTVKNVQADGKNIILELGSENLPNNKNDIIDRMRQIYVVPNKSGENDGKDFEANPRSGTVPYGTGPFGWGEIPRGENSKKIILEAGNGDWSPLGAPNIDKIIIEEIPLLMNHWSQMSTGNINLLIKTTRTARESAKSDSKLKLKPFASDHVSFLLFNYKEDIFDEKEVRLGIDLSIDKERLAQETLKGDATVISGPFSSQSPYFDPTVASRKKNIKEAEKLLNNSLTKNEDGFFEIDGKPISLLFIYDKNINNSEKAVLDQIEQNLKDIGFKVRRKGLLAPSYKAYLKNGRFHIAYYRHQYDRRSFAHPLFASNRLIKQNRYPDLNYGKFYDKNVDIIVGEWTKARDRVSKNRIGKDFHKRLNDEVASIFLFSQKSYAIHRANVEPIIVPYYFFGRPHEWTIENK